MARPTSRSSNRSVVALAASALALGAALVSAACGESAAAAKPPLTAADLGEPSGDIDPNVIGLAVRNNNREFQLCYESARERNPSLAGQVEVRFVVNTDGTVGPAAVAQSSLPKDVSECIARAFSRIILPPTERAAVAQYPMFLDPN